MLFYKKMSKMYFGKNKFLKKSQKCISEKINCNIFYKKCQKCISEKINF